MEALVFRAVGDAALVDVPDPYPRSGEVLISVSATGLCHTDHDILHGRYLGDYPVIPGHEIAGTVSGVGDGVHIFRIGDRVAVDPLLPCRHCAACHAGRPSLCDDLRAYGATSHGGFAPMVAVKTSNVHSVGDLPFQRAALAEPFACVLHGIDRARVADGVRTLIFGAGPIGLMMMLSLQVRHDAAVTVVDLDDTRLERALAFGATAACNARDTDGLRREGRFGLVVDCTGTTAVCESMPTHAADGATLLFFGVCPPGIKAGFCPNEIFRRELNLVGSHSLSDNLPDAIAVLRDLGERADRLVSHRLPLAGIAAHLRNPQKSGSLKIQYCTER